ncbi:outer membrane protein assembly factor BamC [Alishewanella longhuensis]|uniref:Outer membrane protein assembly factor BamC n=1 Tax=Alishewanella longhuensis TaxID=1091037 RepID=A0ABQ3KYX3_9ALTE|nr:outer membrane protein assembly factor BamC [Alishewanella longhuensis]GHG70910.1 outer membrane protein assembly factor BamC [Alishewanella longhuensis]
MQKWAQGCVAVSVLLSGCAVFDKTPAENKDARQVTLRIPAGMAVPNQPSAYDIPAISTASTNSGTLIDKRSPTLILATASSSRLEEEEKLARVWFERNDYTGDIKPFISEQLQQFFVGQQVRLTQTDETGLRYETGWITRSRSAGFWFWKSENAVDQVRYAIELAPRPHGRSLSMTVALLEHQYFVPGEQLTAVDVKANEVNLLNRVINQVAIAEAKIAREMRAQVAEVSLEPGMDQAGNPALVTSQPLDVTWSQLELLFSELNLTVTDFDRSVFTYFVNYTKPERGFWRAVTFRSAPTGLPLVEGDYQIVLSRLPNNNTAISWLNKDGQPLSAAEVTALYEPVVAAIRAAGAEL